MLLVSVPFTIQLHIHRHTLALRAHKNGKLEEDHVTICKIFKTGHVLPPAPELVTLAELWSLSQLSAFLESA